MATKEQVGLFRVKDGENNEHILYPITKAEAINGLGQLAKLDKVGKSNLNSEMLKMLETLEMSNFLGGIDTSNVIYNGAIPESGEPYVVPEDGYAFIRMWSQNGYSIQLQLDGVTINTTSSSNGDEIERCFPVAKGQTLFAIQSSYTGSAEITAKIYGLKGAEGGSGGGSGGSNIDLSDYYTKEEVYTKEETTNLLKDKATMTQVNEAINNAIGVALAGDY